jgi:hypothetical protein
MWIMTCTMGVSLLVVSVLYCIIHAVVRQGGAGWCGASSWRALKVCYMPFKGRAANCVRMLLSLHMEVN